MSMTATATPVKSRPILFSGPMVRAILEGRKTATRRVVKPQPEHGVMPCHYSPTGWAYMAAGQEGCTCRPIPCKQGTIGDRLWVRETWKYADWTEDGEPFIGYAADGAVSEWPPTPSPGWEDRVYDEWAALSSPENRAIDGKSADRKWRPSIFMPAWASRITLEITGVKVEWLQDITDDDAIAEGMDGRYSCTDPTRKADKHNVPASVQFACLWNEINGPKYPWKSNPWVWCISFRRITP
jgi:hypothetical protein